MRPTAKTAAFLHAVEAALLPLADARRATDMSAYMRGRFAYLGIQTPARRAAVKDSMRNFAPASANELRQAIDALWQRNEREYQYVAVDLLARNPSVLGLDDLPWLLDLAQKKSWWDTVDFLAKAAGHVVRRSGVKGKQAMSAAVRHENFWVRRIAMLHQLGWRQDTDTRRLFAYAELLAPETEFFIRKAIGWALRDYAWHDAAAIEQFLESRPGMFSGLTVREASKNFAKLKRGR
jgi:3-methyladenine DNA glycosylase AlkD